MVVFVIYSIEMICGPIKVFFLLSLAEMRMLRWVCGKTIWDRIRNVNIRESWGSTYCIGKMVENMLRWFGHVETRPVGSVLRKIDQMIIELEENMVYDRTFWRNLIHVANPA